MAFQKTLIILIVVLSIVLVLVAGVGAWFYFNQSTGVYTTNAN
jgi:flagellar basal body-associated protein FliL